MPYRKRGKKGYVMAINLPDGRRAMRACGTSDKTTARLIEGTVRTLARERQWGALEAIYEKRVTPGDVYDAVRAGRLTELLSSTHDVDIRAMLTDYRHYLQARGVKCATDYLRHVSQYAAKHPLASEFTTPMVSAYLTALPAKTGATRNRHRGSLTRWGEWLIERGVLETNPVARVRAFRENRPRMVYYNAAEAQALIDRLPSPYLRALMALLAGTGMEWATIPPLTARDINFQFQFVHAHGTKKDWRDREVAVMEDWAWSIFAPYACSMAEAGPHAVIFPLADKQVVLRAHHRAAEKAGLPKSTLHDWRHTFAVMQRRKGIMDSVIAHQLGHKDTRQVQERYGRFKVERSDYSILQAAR